MVATESKSILPIVCCSPDVKCGTLVYFYGSFTNCLSYLVMIAFQIYFVPVALLLFFFTSGAAAQESSHRFKSTGVFTGIGFETDPGIHYRPFFFGGDLCFQLSKKKRAKGFLTWYLEPQFNAVATEGATEMEFGTNIGIRNYMELSPRLFFYQMLGTGPHFITARLRRQATGFLFSDNLAVGFLKQVNKHNPIFLNVQIRQRHISNASLKQPNGGIDNFNVLLGISKFR